MYVRISTILALLIISVTLQNLKSKLSIVAEERDKLTTQMENQQKHVVEVELFLKHCQDEVD